MNMEKIFAVLLITGFAMLTGCFEVFEDSPEFRRARAAKAMSLLKKYQVAATLHQVETGRYPTLAEIYEASEYSGVITPAFYDAWDALDDPRPLEGYLYSEIETDSYGHELERLNYAGLCAYPAEPGKSGDLIICILADPGSFDDGQIKEFGGVSHGDEWTFYTAIFKDIGEPLYSWPDDELLEEKFTALKKRKPQEGLLEAQRLADSVSRP